MKIGLFFGAGAERSYNLPSGGKFALVIFRANVEDQKQELKDHLKRIDIRSPYARKWLPSGFEKKPVYAFGKSEFGSLLQSSIEYKSDDILENLANFDDICENILNEQGISSDHINQMFLGFTQNSFGERTYEESVKLNKILVQQAHNKNIFSSKFYSALLDIIEKTKNSRLRKFASAILQLFVCVIGQKVIRDLNQELFEQNETNLSIFDDMTTNFNMDFSRLGLTILEIVLDNDTNKIYIHHKDELPLLFEDLFSLALVKMFENCLDYRKLIDEHFRYLFTPKTQWAKFTKMVIFLKTVVKYISKDNILKISNDGYYHDLVDFSENVNINAVGTSNYNNILDRIATELSLPLPSIQFLNGNVKSFYNPYKNSILDENLLDEYKMDDAQIVVPFILTQSGLKPLTSITISQRYVNLYEKFKESDALVCIGFGFNSDDSHINGIFRQLVEDDHKHLFYITLDTHSDQIAEKIKENIRLGYTATSRLHIVPVDAYRKVENINWTKHVENAVNDLGGIS